eukprot:g32382.t1
MGVKWLSVSMQSNSALVRVVIASHVGRADDRIRPGPVQVLCLLAVETVLLILTVSYRRVMSRLVICEASSGGKVRAAVIVEETCS